MASGIYNAGILGIVNRSIDFVGDDIRVALIKTGAGFVFDKTHATLAAALGSAECDATGYVPKVASGKSIAQNDAVTPVTFRLGDITWTGLGGALNNTLDGVLVYLHTGNPATAVPLFWGDSNNLGSNGSDVVAEFDAYEGIAHLTNA